MVNIHFPAAVQQSAGRNFDDVDSRIDNFADAIAAQAKETYLYRFDKFAPLLESPIERLLAAALLANLSWLPPDGISVYFCNHYNDAVIPSKNIVHIYPQAEIGAYRVDFLIEYSDDGLTTMFRVAIECDGHDFHERTKRQAKKDRQRDRWMQNNNIYILRFTGSEIWVDALGCADQIYEFLYNKIIFPAKLGVV